MRIVADENIPCVHDAFSRFGEVVLLPGRSITNVDLRAADILLVRSVTMVNEALLAATPVRFVGSATIGIDHIDTVYLQKRQIGFAAAPGSNANSVAEFVVAALIALQRRGLTLPRQPAIGIIGVGAIGCLVKKYAETLGMQTILCDPPKQRITNTPAYRPLSELLARADIVTLHVPLQHNGTDATVGMVDHSFLDRMRSGTVLINTSRGHVVNEAALLHHRSRLGALVLDVWHNEPAIDGKLVTITDIATPHIAGYSHDGKLRGTELLYHALCAHLSAEPRWSHADHSSREPLTNVTCKEDPVADAVLGAYPIEEDDRKLREMLTLDHLQRPAFFDALRSSYPRRREFSRFLVTDTGSDPAVAATLERLGFVVNRFIPASAQSPS